MGCEERTRLAEDYGAGQHQQYMHSHDRQKGRIPGGYLDSCDDNRCTSHALALPLILAENR